MSVEEDASSRIDIHHWEWKLGRQAAQRNDLPLTVKGSTAGSTEVPECDVFSKDTPSREGPESSNETLTPALPLPMMPLKV